MQEFVKKYICHCNTCKQRKVSKFKKQGVLWPLLVLDQKWQEISIDFVTNIPAVNCANTINIIIDCFFIKRYHIATDKEIDAKRLADLFVRYV